MHVEIVPNRGSPPAVLLRESFREGNKVRKRTLANLSALPMDQVEAIRAVLRGEKLVPAGGLFETVRSFHHGHVQAVQTTMRRVGFEKLLGSRPSPERDLVMAMVTAQILEPESKLAMTRWWKTTTLASSYQLDDTNENDLYGAMDWLLARQQHIEKKLVSRHLKDGGLVLCDVSSSYFEGVKCPLGALGYNRDGKKGKLQVNYGLMTDPRGCPVAISVFKGNTADPKTLIPQVQQLRDTYGVDSMVLVGDRGMISQKQIVELKDMKGVEWVTALKNGAIRALVAQGHLQLGLFDERQLFEVTSPDFPSERLIACRNPELAKLRAYKRSSLLDATTAEMNKVVAMVERGTLKGRDKIGLRVGKVLNKHKMAKHFELTILDDQFSFLRLEDNIAEEAALDGIYVVRTSLPLTKINEADAVRTYKRLSQVERAFRSIKSIDLEIRPIRHHTEDRVRAHILLCMLSYYVAWHMMEAWRPLLFSDEDLAAKESRDPVAPSRRSARAEAKAGRHTDDNGEALHSFQTLLKDLSTIVSNVCRRADNPELTFNVLTTPTPSQQRAYDLLEAINTG